MCISTTEQREKQIDAFEQQHLLIAYKQVDKVHSLRALSPLVAVMDAATQQTYLQYHLVKHHVTTQAAQSSTVYINWSAALGQHFAQRRNT